MVVVQVGRDDVGEQVIFFLLIYIRNTLRLTAMFIYQVEKLVQKNIVKK